MKASAGSAPLTIDEILARFDNVQPNGDGWTACCPAHVSQSRASLSIKPGDTKALVAYCFGGCDTERVLDTVGLTMADLSGATSVSRNGHTPGPAPASKSRPKLGPIVATYDYLDGDGTLIYQVTRHEPKDFRQRRPDGKGGWIWDLKGVTRLPYHLPRLLAAPLDRPIFVVEGEKDVESLETLGVVATCNSEGAGKWPASLTPYFASRPAIAIPDNDTTGCDHSQLVARSLHGVAASVRVVSLPDLPEHGDVSDWIAAGGTLEALADLILAAPVWEPPTDAEVKGANPPHTVNVGTLGPLGTLVRLHTVEPEPVRWLWPGYLALGKIAILDGDPGLGKSLVTIDLAARVSSGRPMPHGPGGDLDGPAGVVMLSAEDDPADTIRPRLDAAGGDAARVAVLSLIQEKEGERLPQITDLAAIRQACIEMDAKLLILDPLMAYLAADTNAHKDQDVRRALAPLAALAADLDIAVIIVRHLNKAAGGNPLYRGGGSIGIIGAARTGFVIAKDPDDETRRVMAPTKNNLAAMPPSLSFSIITYQNVGSLRWQGESKYTADTLLSAPENEEEGSALQDAKGVLTELLRDGSRPAAEIEAEAKAAGISVRTLKRARASLKVRSTKTGEGGTWELSLPAAVLADLHTKEANSAKDAKNTGIGDVGTLDPEESEVGA